MYESLGNINVVIQKWLFPFHHKRVNRAVAQLVEHYTDSVGVGGSIPPRPTNVIFIEKRNLSI